MKKVTIIVERAENNFSAYVRGVDGIAVTGNSIDTIKSSMIAAISEYVDMCKELSMEIPAEFSEGYELSFELDIRSLLTIYEGIFAKSALERLTGINQKQLWHYAHGKSVPRPAQRRKIETALHRLGSELVSLSL